ELRTDDEGLEGIEDVRVPMIHGIAELSRAPYDARFFARVEIAGNTFAGGEIIAPGRGAVTREIALHVDEDALVLSATVVDEAGAPVRHEWIEWGYSYDDPAAPDASMTFRDHRCRTD